MRIMDTLLSGLVCPTPGHAIFHGCRRPRFIRTSNPSRKKTDAFNLYLNMQGSFNVYFNNGNEEQTSFRMNQLRIEAKGNITDRIYYRYRQRLNRANNAQSLDNLPTSIDYAAVGFHVTDQFSVFAGNNVLHSEDSNST